MAKRVTTTIEFAYIGNHRGVKVAGTSQSTEHWDWPDNKPVDMKILAIRHRDVWIARMKNEHQTYISANKVRVLGIQVQE